MVARKQDRRRYLGSDKIQEANKYKYLEVWINRQANGLGYVKYLRGKASKLHGIAGKEKFWRGTEDIEAGLVMWEVACKPGLNYGSEVWACSSCINDKVLEQILEKACPVVLGV